VEKHFRAIFFNNNVFRKNEYIEEKGMTEKGGRE
jgi:hypothetical protein